MLEVVSADGRISQSDCLITSSISQGRPQKKPADHNC